ncbi:HBR026Wp [Eremothecium sinecaudum]|uniref:HBR026Wp n=1 Tax=Eremothecium sinecaudum TaxID=45286 RepID=A0A109UX44_9SACH|nr:HBR026Wp [Eremothecium sinecaudum]AMD18927.1 HBR026Wp [Eremothecium sinecaudum]
MATTTANDVDRVPSGGSSVAVLTANEVNQYNVHGYDLERGDSPNNYEACYKGNDNGLNSIKDFAGLATDEYVEDIITLKEFYSRKIKHKFTVNGAFRYCFSLFPLVAWIPHYNLVWLYCDFVAGITVGCVLIPQSMSYAQLAGLSPEYGLYSSFVGALIYSFFATSKDICIGPVAVMSLMVGRVIEKILSELPEGSLITAPIIATTLSLCCGLITTAIGLLRFGFVVEFISLNAILGFVTGAGLSIITSQLPSLMGVPKPPKGSTLVSFISFLKNIPQTRMDAVFGILTLFVLYFWRWIAGSVGPKLVKRSLPPGSRASEFWKDFFFYADATRSVITIIVGTVVSWLITRGKQEKLPIAILGFVPSGLQNVGLMKIPDGLLSKIAPEAFAATLVLLLEHLAIGKSFARVNNYTISPDQELVAIGATNLLGTFFNAYPATGSFSRTALKSKCKVKTPISGVFSGGFVLFALYLLTDAFYYIPKSALAAVIIHAVADLISSHKTAVRFWKLSPLDAVSFLATIIITITVEIEMGIYFAIGWSLVVMLLGVIFPSGKFMGYVKVTEIVNPSRNTDTSSAFTSTDGSVKIEQDSNLITSTPDPQVQQHTKWVPLDNSYSRELNPSIVVNEPPPGVIVYRPTESFIYLNSSRQIDTILAKVKKLTKPKKIKVVSNKEKKWCDCRPPNFVLKLTGELNTNSDFSTDNIDDRPTLKILAMDWSQVTQVDATAIQNLVDLRKSIETYVGRQVQFHFSGILSPWIKRSLINAGFGQPKDQQSLNSACSRFYCYDVVDLNDPQKSDHRPSHNLKPALGSNMPFFHLEMPDFSTWRLEEEQSL